MSNKTLTLSILTSMDVVIVRMRLLHDGVQHPRLEVVTGAHPLPTLPHSDDNYYIDGRNC